MAGRSRKYGKKSKRIGYKRTRGHKHMGGYKRTRKGQTKRMVKRRGKRTRRGGAWVNYKGKWISEEQIKKDQHELLLKVINEKGITKKEFDDILNKLYDIFDNTDDLEKLEKADNLLKDIEMNAEIYHSSGDIMPFINSLYSAAQFSGIDIEILKGSTPPGVYDIPFSSTSKSMGTYFVPEGEFPPEYGDVAPTPSTYHTAQYSRKPTNPSHARQIAQDKNYALAKSYEPEYMIMGNEEEEYENKDL